MKTASRNAESLSPERAVPRQPSIECCIGVVGTGAVLDLRAEFEFYPDLNFCGFSCEFQL